MDGSKPTLVDLPPGKRIVGCKWLFTIKYHPDGSLDKLKTCLVAKGYSQTQGLDYTDKFSRIAKVNSVRMLISWAASSIRCCKCFFMVICKRKYTWSNLLSLWLRESPRKCVSLENLFMDLNNLPEHDLINFVPFYQNLGLKGVYRITLCLLGNHQGGVSF